jgi:hypothetical protein
MSFVWKAIASNRSLSSHAAAGLLCLSAACGNGSGFSPAAPPDNGSTTGSTSGDASTGSSSGGSLSSGGSTAGNPNDGGAPSLGSAGGGAFDGGSDGAVADGGGDEDVVASDGGLDPNVAPGGNFDLSMWELEEPVGSPGASTTIPPSQLEGASGYHDSYFFTNPTDGSMTFWDPENGVTSIGSTYPRSDLREMTDGGVPASWPTAGTNSLSATLKATLIPDHVAVGEIHLGGASTKPLLELYYHGSGTIAIAIAETRLGNVVEHTLGSVPLGTQWSYVLGLSGSTISVSIDGGVAQTFAMSPRFRREGMYFRAGDYDQSAGDGGTIGALVQFYALQIVHGP